MPRKPGTSKAAKPAKTVTTLTHDDKRKNIPTGELEPVLHDEHKKLKVLRYPRNPDLDPQLVWRGKDFQDEMDLIVKAPPLFIQEKVHPKVLIDDLRKITADAKEEQVGETFSLFADFNGMPKDVDKTEFYEHDQHWTNRMILGDSLAVMGSLAEREALRGKVQCIYFDPPYGIKFNSNFQWSTTNRDVKDGSATHITREPEQVKAFRDTWRDGIHSYLSYIRDRLVVARDLLTESGSIFVQIGDENVHRVRAVMDEVFGEENCISQIAFRTTTGRTSDYLAAASNFLIWFAKDSSKSKYRAIYQDKFAGSSTEQVYTLLRIDDGSNVRITNEQRKDSSLIPSGSRLFRPDNITSSRPAGDGDVRKFGFDGRAYTPGKGTFKTDEIGLTRLSRSDRIWPTSKGTIQYVRYFDDFPVIPFSNMWTDTGTGSFTDDKVYVVQTGTKVIERCILMTTDPGDLVLDPTCGSGTTAYVAEQWGRRWITIDTSRVALALARARLMGARYPYYLLADSQEGRMQEAKLSGRAYIEKPSYHRVRNGFVYERVPHITLKSIANNAEIDVIYDEQQPLVEAALAALNKALQGHKTPYLVLSGGRAGKKINFAAKDKEMVKLPSGEEVKANALLEWEVPRNKPIDWPDASKELLEAFWQARIARQQAIDQSIATRAEFEYLYDKPVEDKKTVRVAGPFTVETISPRRMLETDEEGNIVDPWLRVQEQRASYGKKQSFDQIVLENLKLAGVQQADKKDKINFNSVEGHPGKLIGMVGTYMEGDTLKTAGIYVGPEFGTVSRPDIVEAAREASDMNFDALFVLAFSYDPYASDMDKLGKMPVLRVRMNADLHMAGDLKPGRGNLFILFGEPDIELKKLDDGQYQVSVRGIDIYDPSTGEVRSDDTDGIACWMIDTNYDNESFFVRHAYFLGQNDPYKALKTSLKAEINEEAWSSLNSDVSRPFAKPATGRIAVKMINHLGDEVMKVIKI